MKMLLVTLLVFSSWAQFTDGACTGTVDTYDYNNQENFEVTLKPNPDQLDAPLCLKQAPNPAKIGLTDKRQKVTIAAKNGDFKVELLEFEFSGASMAFVKMLSNGKTIVQSKHKRKGAWTKVTLRNGDTSIDQIVISFKFSKKVKTAFLQGVFLGSCLSQGSSSSSSNKQKKLLMSRDEFMGTFGLGKERYAKAMLLATKIQKLVAKNLKLKIKNPKSIAFGDILMTPEQLEALYNRILSKRGKGKGKRAIFDENHIWDNAEVPYSVDASFSFHENITIQKAIDHWEENTCIRFRRVVADSNGNINEHHVAFTLVPFGGSTPAGSTAEENTCKSYIGKNVAVNPQPIYLTSTCLRLNEPGKTIHAIGHTLGFHHEALRHDRDSFVSIQYQHLHPQFSTVLTALGFLDVTKLSPYDYNSIMHFTSWAFGIDRINFTIKTTDPLFQQNIGQEVALSYYDRLAAKDIYCRDRCAGSTTVCERNGYPDPNSCSRCVCPTGFQGNCSKTDFEPFDYRGCNPDFYDLTVSDTERCVTSPEYDMGRNYHPRTYCNWRLKAPAGRKIELQFRERFDVLCRSAEAEPVQCLHWIEIKFKQHLTEPGPRFCCRSKPNIAPLVSESNEAIINFNARFSSNTRDRLDRPGFKLCYKLHN